MNTVLQKTMHSLEAALRYNPSSVELMASLAEVYVRLGRFDKRTMELCETVLSRQVDNALLRQAQSIGLLIEQSRAIEDGLREDQEFPDTETLQSSLEILDEFLADSSECIDGWTAWARFQILVGAFDKAAEGIEKLTQLGQSDLRAVFQRSLEHAAERVELTAEKASELAGLYRLLGDETQSVELLEQLYDGGQTAIGKALLQIYLERYSPSPTKCPRRCAPGFLRCFSINPIKT